MYSFKEKKTHFVALRNPDVAQYDLELLAKEVPGFPQLATFSRNPKRYADDILYALLDCATREKIREYRRAMIAKEAEGFVTKFEAAMDDDFNTADAISAIFEIVRLSNSTISEASTKAYVSYVKETMDKLCDVLGIITEKKEEILDSEVEDLIAKRQQARKEKNFALADEIRGRLSDMGIILEDTREGVKWKRA